MRHGRGAAPPPCRPQPPRVASSATRCARRHRSPMSLAFSSRTAATSVADRFARKCADSKRRDDVVSDLVAARSSRDAIASIDRSRRIERHCARCFRRCIDEDIGIRDRRVAETRQPSRAGTPRQRKRRAEARLFLRAHREQPVIRLRCRAVPRKRRDRAGFPCLPADWSDARRRSSRRRKRLR